MPPNLARAACSSIRLPKWKYTPGQVHGSHGLCRWVNSHLHPAKLNDYLSTTQAARPAVLSSPSEQKSDFQPM